jgi:hypothetical protein
VQRDDGWSLLKCCELGFNLQSLGFEFGDAPTSIILSNDPLDDQVNVALAFALDPRPLRLKLCARGCRIRCQALPLLVVTAGVGFYEARIL